MKRGKKYTELAQQVSRDRLYPAPEAIDLIKTNPVRKFDETLEIHFNLGIDPRQADQQIRGTLVLPHGTGRTIRICVVTTGEKVLEAKDAGADFVGSEDIVEKIQGGWLDFDLVIGQKSFLSSQAPIHSWISMGARYPYLH